MADDAEIHVGPNPGPQTQAVASCADITFFGGRAGPGKSWSTLFRFGLHAALYPGYFGVIFRREMPMVTVGGGLWEESFKLYPIWGARPNSSSHHWRFPNGSLIQFRSLQYEKDMINYQGSQLAEYAFEELTHFLDSQWWYLYSRLRTTARHFRTHKPFKARAFGTMNPDPDHWVRAFIDWWIDKETGLAIPERAGKLRWFLREPSGDQIIWGDSAEEVAEAAPHVTDDPSSVRFIPALLADNPKGDPDYQRKLMALPYVERERLLGGNWNARPTTGTYFKRRTIPIVDKVPMILGRIARGWDLAATEPTVDNPNPDWTVGVKAALLEDLRILILHVEMVRLGPGGVDEVLRITAAQDGIACTQCFWQDPGQAGKAQINYLATVLRSFPIASLPERENKLVYAGPPSSAAENGRILLLRGDWNEPFLNALEAFPKGKKDHVDALSRVYMELCGSIGDEMDQRYDSYLPGVRM